MQIIKCFTCLTLSLVAVFSHAEKTALNVDSNYSQSVWSAGHRDASNTDYVPLVMSKKMHIKKRLLQGHPIFWAPISGSDGNFYVTSGKGQGGSNLHSFDSDGNLRWKSKPQESLDDLDGWAIINAPIVAKNGDIYVGDQNQLWAFKPNGDVKWLVELSQYDVTLGFMTAVISRQGYIGGISSNGKVIFFKPEDGALAMPVLDLPGGDGPAAKDTPPDDLWKGLMDPKLKADMFNLIQGWAMEVANTPAVHPDTGRVYITAYGQESGSGLLYGIDVFDDHLEIAFQASMGQGSGTSPAISQNGERVYALDEFGHMISIDAKTGERMWKSTQKGGGAASPSVGPDESIYTLFHDHLLGFNYDGSVKFEYKYNDFCGEQIESPGWFWGLLLSKPVAFLDSLFTVAADNTGWMNVVCGYHLKFIPSKSERTLVPVPNRSMLLAVNLDTGEPLGEPIRIPETSEGFVLPMHNGNQFVTLSGAISSIFYYSLNALLPSRYEVPHEPEAGLLLMEPESRIVLLAEAISWVGRQNQLAIDQLQQNQAPAALKSIAETRLQLDSNISILRLAVQENTLSQGKADSLIDLSKQLSLQIDKQLEAGQPSMGQLRETQTLLQQITTQIDSVIKAGDALQ